MVRIVLPPAVTYRPGREAWRRGRGRRLVESGRPWPSLDFAVAGGNFDPRTGSVEVPRTSVELWHIWPALVSAAQRAAVQPARHC
jgi:hypothetical protein